MNRKRLLLAALAGLLILSLAYAFWAMPRQETAPPRVETARPAVKKPLVGKKQPPPADRLHLGLLAQEPQAFPGAKRDIFRFHGGWAQPVEELDEVESPAMEEVAPPPPPPPPTPEELLRGVVTRITFLGFLEKGGIRTVFLSGDGELFLVKSGETFGKDKSLVAREITDKELVVGWLQGPEIVRVKLVENEALKPAMLTPGLTPRSTGNGFRPGGMAIPPRRSILPPRGVARPVAPPPAEEVIDDQVEEESQPPDDGVEQEEPPNEEAPGGEGNGN